MNIRLAESHAGHVRFNSLRVAVIHWLQRRSQSLHRNVWTSGPSGIVNLTDDDLHEGHRVTNGIGRCWNYGPAEGFKSIHNY